ncbi:DUF4190 domain-containing protein [Mycobacterium sp.]|uniref:DUF4190 domain-containing protein n=1 Tax=Mycobacterium sp. TaxID=1785 RepID=UPI00262DA5FE|nr:DUF4190 domain-containing protein [Mycobacterium sp.]
MPPDRDPFHAASSDAPGSLDFTAPYADTLTGYGMSTSRVSGPPLFGPRSDVQSSFARGDYFSGTSAWPQQPAPPPPLNTYAVLALVFGILVPPAGVAVGHLALPQIKRTGQRGWLAAVCGLVIGYLLCVVLLVLLVWLVAVGDRGSNGAAAMRSSVPEANPLPSVVTSIAPAPIRPHIKIDLGRAMVGQCVEIEKRDEAGDGTRDDALDLYEVPCQHRPGVYTVVARAPADAECNSTYVASPPDRSFSVCLNRY